MKTRFLAIIIALAALVGGGLWYLRQPAAADRPKIAEAPKLAVPAPTTLKPPTQIKIVEAPKAPP